MHRIPENRHLKSACINVVRPVILLIIEFKGDTHKLITQTVACLSSRTDRAGTASLFRVSIYEMSQPHTSFQLEGEAKRTRNKTGNREDKRVVMHIELDLIVSVVRLFIF